MRRIRSSLAVLALALLSAVASATVPTVPAGAGEIPAWTRVLTVDGGILSVSPDAVLYGSPNGEIHHLDRSTGVDRVVAGSGVGGGFNQLTSFGTLVTVSAPAGFPAARLQHWTPSGTIDLGIVAYREEFGWPVAAAGNFVAWSRQRDASGTGGGLLLRDLATGAERVVTATVVGEVDVAADGSVAWVEAGHVFRDRAGTRVQVTPAGPGTQVHGPRTDGTTVMYSRFMPGTEPDTGLTALIASEGTGEQVLAGPHECRLIPYASDCPWFDGIPSPGREYEIGPDLKTWTDGGLWRQVGASPPELVFDGWTWIVTIGPARQIVFHHLLGLSGEIIIADDPYFAAADGTVVPIHHPAEAALGWAGLQPIAYRGGELYHLELDDVSAPQRRYDPDDVTAAAGEYVEFRAEIGGYPQPVIGWERSVDGVTFEPVPPDQPSQERALSILSVQAGAGGYQFFRAVATGPAGTVVTRAARLTVGLTTVVPGSVEVAEGDAGTVTAELPVTLTPTNQPVYVDWRTVEVPGLSDQATPGTDYQPASGRLVVSTYEGSGTVPITVLGDTGAEANERIVVAFSNASGANIGGFYGLGVITIRDDDRPLVRIGVGAAVEGEQLRVPVSLTRPATDVVSVQWATVFAPGFPVQAEPRTDYQPASGTLTFAVGQTQSEIAIATSEDLVPEPPEGFLVLIGNATGAWVDAWGVGGGTVLDDD